MIDFVVFCFAALFILIIVSAIARFVLWLKVVDPEGYTWGAVVFVIAFLIWPEVMAGVGGAAVLIGLGYFVLLLGSRLVSAIRAGLRKRP